MAPPILPITDDTQVLVLTGAGVSAESGLQTFRGEGGLWRGIRAEDIATPGAFDANSDLVWRFYSERRAKAGQASPNSAHLALVDLERRLGDRFLLATQNVDALHLRAGSRNVIELHGNLYRTKCSRPGCPAPVSTDIQMHDVAPVCEICGRDLRPDIVWFGEELNPLHLARISSFLSRARELPLLFLAVGTSGVVQPASMMVDVASRLGATTFLVNEDEAENGASFDYFIKGKAGMILPEIFNARA